MHKDIEGGGGAEILGTCVGGGGELWKNDRVRAQGGRPIFSLM